MKKLTVMAAALAATTALGCAAYAADASAPQSDQQTAASDFTKVSRDGARAFARMTDARLALFEGDADRAGKLVADAQSSFDKARADGAAFMKAEEKLAPPAGLGVKGQATADASKPVSWIPVDATMSVTEDFSMRPDRHAKAEKTSDESAAKPRARMEVARPLDMRTSYALAILPVDQVSDSLSAAVSDLKDGKFYEANLALKKGQDSLRFDVAAVDEQAARRGATAEYGASRAKPDAAVPVPEQAPAPRS